MLGSVAGYFFSVITVFATVMTFMTLLIGVFDNSAFEKLRHYPRPIIERSAPAPPILEPHRIPNSEPHHTLVALGTNEGTAPKDLSARDENTTKDTRAVSIAKADAENRKPERKIKWLAHLEALQRQSYEEHGYAMRQGPCSEPWT